jgi:hypothetical protein
MREAKWTVVYVVLVGTLAIGTLAAQDAAPKGTFKTVHLVTLAPTEEATLTAALAEINAAVAKAGHAEIRYRVYKVTGKQAGNYNYMWEAAFPSGAVYDSVHQNPAFQAAIQKHPEFDRLRNNEVYNRYVEVTLATR